MGNFHSSVFFLFVWMVYRGEPKTYWGDTEVLKQLKSAISASPGSCVSSWDFSFDPCDSLFSNHFTCGFRCDDVVSGASRVTDLTLDSAAYSGSLASSSWNLPYLRSLDVSNNLFSGPIPNSIAGLTRLTRLALSRNAFAGQIPASIGSMSQLEELYIDGNDLVGVVPPGFNGLVGLKRLEIQSNKLSGRFPQLGSLRNLYFLDASNNFISGELPAVLPPYLVQLTMRNNKLQGAVPGWFKNLKSLQVLDLTNNQLTGSVPSALFEHPSQQQLALSLNRFSSVQIPQSRGVGSRLIAVDLSNNELQGTLPAFMAGMPRLSALSLENNKLTGVIPTQYGVKTAVAGGGVAQLSRLFLGGNYLSGGIPRAMLGLNEGSSNVRLADNCLYRCPARFYFCQGGAQKSPKECNTLNH